VASFTLRHAARILKVSPQRLRRWERTLLARLRRREQERAQAASAHSARPGPPAQSESVGGAPDAAIAGPAASAREREEGFEFRDLVCARALLDLIDQGIPLRRIRRSVEALRDTVPELDDPLPALRVWDEASRRMVVDHGGVLLEPDGQMVLDFREEGDGSPAVEDLGPRRRAAEAAQAEREAREAAVRAEEWFERGCELDADASTWAEAEAAYRSALEADPGFADAHCNLGAVLYNRGRRGEARRCFERCLEIEPRHVEALFNYANVLEEAGDDQRALRHYLAALREDPLYPDLHVNLGLLYEKLGDAGRAQVHWRRYLQLEPKGAWSEVARSRVGPRPD